MHVRSLLFGLVLIELAVHQPKEAAAPLSILPAAAGTASAATCAATATNASHQLMCGHPPFGDLLVVVMMVCRGSSASACAARTATGSAATACAASVCAATGSFLAGTARRCDAAACECRKCGAVFAVGIAAAQR